MHLLFSVPVGMGVQHLIRELEVEIFAYLAHTFADSTKGTYKTYRNTHFQFCLFIGCNPLPAPTQSICQYAAFLARTLKFSSIRNYLTIISLLHKEFSLPNPIQDNWVVKSLLQGIKRVKGGEINQKLPITPEILLGIRSKLNLRHSFDASFWAVCLVAFYGLFRKSHLLPTSNQLFDPTKQFTLGDFTFHPWGLLLKVGWSKTIQFRERMVYIPIPRIPNSPICAFQAVVNAFGFIQTAKRTCHAFSWIDHKSLLIHCLTYRSFLAKLKTCLGLLGYHTTKYAGHSFHRGGGHHLHSKQGSQLN